jgi:DNA repair exonuclease SbcCD ATPase subunit
VPATEAQNIRKAYQRCQEQFYDLVKINIELRDLDFKKNLELKTKLCEAAEKLQDNGNIVEASRALQQLHDEWAEIGPVARELREEIWNRFKTASSVINKKHQAYFDELHAKEQANLEAKQAIIEQLKQINEPLVNGEPMSAKQWEELTEKIQSLQNEWRKIGFAPKKFNQSIYDQYRALCDQFFQTKNAFFKTRREEWKARAEQRKIREEQRKAREEKRAEQRVAKTEDQLLRIRERLRQEIKVAENNILFFTAKSKTANKLVDSMQSKIDELKKQLDDIQQKLDAEQ